MKTKKNVKLRGGLEVATKPRKPKAKPLAKPKVTNSGARDMLPKSESDYLIRTTAGRPESRKEKQIREFYAKGMALQTIMTHVGVTARQLFSVLGIDPETNSEYLAKLEKYRVQFYGAYKNASM